MNENIHSLIVKYITNEISTLELIEIKALINSNKQFKKEVFELKHVYDNINYSSIDFELKLNEIVQKLNFEQQFKSTNKTSPTNIKLMLKIASVLIIVLVTSLIYIFDKEQNTELKYETYSSLQSEKSFLKLKDGTKVHLSENSKLQVPSDFSENNRKVVLEGMAFFNVKHNSNSKFLVHTDKANVRVLGTKFNVRSYKGEDYVATTLEKGRVQMEYFTIDSIVELKPGQKSFYSKSTHEIKMKQYSRGVRFKLDKKQISFKSVKFSEVIENLELYYDQEIELQIKDSNEVISCTYINKTLKQVLKSLKNIVNFKITNNNGKLVLK
jgi:ferric-dicitrate binding protein FerR (iron transport regulator)